MNDDFISLPSIGRGLDDLDLLPNTMTIPGTQEYTTPEKLLLEKCVKHLNINNKLHSIVEIGVDRDQQNPMTQTKTFISNKIEECKYIGLDICNREHVKSYGKNCYFFQNDGGDVDNNMKFINSLGIKSIDLLFIDGWHSVNQVLREWEFSKHMSDNGLILLHDSNYHPGPKEVVSKLNTNKWSYKFFCKPPQACYGIAAVWKASSNYNKELSNWDN